MILKGETYEVTGDKVLVVKSTVGSTSKNVEVLGQSNKAAEEQRNNGSPETERSSVGHLVSGNTLGATSANEPDVRNEQRDPGQQTEDRGEVDEVSENGLGVVGSVHEGGAAEESRDCQSRDGDTALIGPPEDLGCVTLLGQTVDGTRSDVQIRVRGTEGEDQDTGVENVGQSLDAGDLDGNNERRSR